MALINKQPHPNKTKTKTKPKDQLQNPLIDPSKFKMLNGKLIKKDKS